MVTLAVREQVSAMPFADRLDLAERIVADVPDLPDHELVALPAAGFRALLDAREEEMIRRPDTVLSAAEAVASLRARFNL